MTIASARPKTGLTEVLSLRGPRALSAFRRERLLARLSARVPGVRGVDAEFWHFAALTSALAPAQAALLERLLTYGPKTATEPLRGEAIVVVPRLGTVSPWSSKATDIARQCGLAVVARLERGVVYYLDTAAPLGEDERAALLPLLHDRMTEGVLADLSQALRLFDRAEPQALRVIDVSGQGRTALEAADRELGLALSADEIDYLLAAFSRAGQNPTDVELMMFAQANSEHCRHKIFNAEWKVNGKRDAQSLFQMIQHTHAHSPRGTLVAYSDNAAVIEGPTAARFVADPDTRAYAFTTEPNHIVMKVETHNHPTAIAPHPGAATGSGGEIRDEGATGCGAKSKAGLTGFSVSNLRIPGAEQPWEVDHGKPARIVSALEIMLDGPLGSSAFNNEFGRPAIAGYFRTFELEVGGEIRGYHKPIMLAGGLGNIRAVHVHKRPAPPGAHILVIGGPAMLIGLGGGAASSVASGSGQEALDFASVQRANAEMQRRCQEVIDQCRALGADNPILSIHDVGAGGLSNAVPEILHGADVGGRFDLRAVPNDQPGMSPMEIWCNEAQERYVVAIDDARLARFLALCARERCPAAAIGKTTAEPRLVVEDPHFAARGERFARPIDVELALLFGKPPRMLREAKPVKRKSARFATGGIDLTEAAYRVLALPTVASKNFLITIGDRSVGGLVCRDQMVGPWQVPVADAGVTASGFRNVTGEAMAIGERAPLALIDPAASARMAIAEAITNIACARIRALGDVKLSANWMAAAGHPGEDAALHAAVRAAALELCPALGVSIPVGKDSLSMKTVWREGGEERAVVAPVSLVVSAFAPVVDARKTITPQLKTDRGETDLLLVDFARGKNRVGGSALAQVYGSVGTQAPDLDDPRVLKLFFALMQALNQLGLLLAYHDRSDGGLFVALCEMAFAGRTGVRVDVDDLGSDPVAALFAEEPGALLQTPRDRRDGILGAFREAGLLRYTRLIGEPTADDHVSIVRGPRALLREPRVALQRAWAETSYRMQALRDDPDCAREEYDAILDLNDPGLNATLSFDPAEDVAAPFVNVGACPRVAILREQGVNGHVEMAAAFDRAGFEAHDVTVSDVIEGRVSLAGFKGLAACGGFSYGDVLGAGEGWAKAILFNARARDEFSAFFARPDTFGLGACNGCQMMSNLREIIPGAQDWPHFVRNRSEQFEARTVLVTIPENPSILFAGMAGSRAPIVVAHGEGRAEFAAAERLQRALARQLVALQFVDNHGVATERYPANPNGSPFGITGLTTPDGRFTAFMPHPERVFRSMSLSWAPSEWGGDSPWLRLFRNARAFVA